MMMMSVRDWVSSFHSFLSYIDCSVHLIVHGLCAPVLRFMILGVEEAAL